MEAVKNLEYSFSSQKCYYYKTKYDLEVDLIVADTTITKAYEIKLSMSPKMHMASGLKALKKDYPTAEVHLISLVNDFPGIPNMPDIKCLHWYETIASI